VGLTQGFVVRDEAVRSPQIGQVILLTLDDDDTVQAQAFKLTKLADLPDAQQVSQWISRAEAAQIDPRAHKAFRDQHGD
jgi:hypothetical protein